MASAIEKLPAELQAHIIGYMCRSADLLSLSLASKTLLRAATAGLYGNFYADEECKRVRHFLRTLCLNAKLPKLVRTLSLSVHRKSPFMAPNSFNRAMFATALEKGMEPGPLLDSALSALRTGCHTAEMLAILCMTTQITDLILELTEDNYTITGDGRILKARFHATCHDCPNFADGIRSIVCRSHTRIREAVLMMGDPNSSMTRLQTENILFDFLGLDSLRSLICMNLLLPSKHRTARTALQCSKLDVLVITNCRIVASTVKEILTTCTSLKTFRLVFPAANPKFSHPEDVAWQVALNRHQSSLKCLNISDTLGGGSAIYGQQGLGSLLGFTSLESFSVDELLLTGKTEWGNVNLADILPTSVSKLKIWSHGELTGIGDILAAFNGWQPNNDFILDITFPIVSGALNEGYIMSWHFEGNPDDHEPQYDREHEGYQGTLFVVEQDSGESADSHDGRFIRFRCTELEVVRGIAKFGHKLQGDGLGQFLEAAYDGEEVTLWEGGPERFAQDMFFDVAGYGESYAFLF